MKLKDITVNVFKVIASDTELLKLLDVPETIINDEKVYALKDIREQILEDKYPSDLVDNNLSRLCIYELQPYKISPALEKGRIEIDVYVTKEKNKEDRRVLVVAERLIDLLDSERRKSRALPSVAVGVGLEYETRLANMQTDSREWVKYGIIFTYDMIRI